MALIKSHSNYVLKKKHQEIADGTIYEKDITTIGGVDSFSRGQIPTYRSNNFIITVRNDGRVSSQYNTKKWESNESGDTWTLETISGLTSDYEDEKDTKIVLKQDYYDLRDFAYYGSLTELFRASVNDIIARFPGELYGTSNDTIYYTSAYTEDFDRIETSIKLGADGEKEVSNPFGINIHSSYKPKEANALKYFAESGYTNYELIEGDNVSGDPITTWSTTYYYSEKKPNGKYDKYTVTYSNGQGSVSSTEVDKYYPCVGDKVATVSINGKTINAYLGDDNVVYYMSSAIEDMHIRPKEEFIAEFYNECDNFEKLLMNPKTTPKYKATFSIIKENEWGYFRELQDFVFPTSDGGHNIDATEYGFSDYTTKMIQVGEYYDEFFTDNLWRSMTHEAIKNFDWTYTREYQEGDEEEYVIGGQRIQKALRVFAREFDEIISYINNIRNSNKVTYDERSNIPDYFLTDVVENDGWDVKLVYPYDLTEYYLDDSGNKKVSSAYTEGGECEGQLGNIEEGNAIIREFTQNSTSGVQPYSSALIDDGTESGYFIICGEECVGGGEEEITGDNTSVDACGGSATLTWTSRQENPLDKIEDMCEYQGSPYTIIKAHDMAMINDTCALGGKGALKYRIKSYTDERTYTYKEANNEFLRRLKINSRNIWRHKGTIEGIEMILAMFGLKSKRFNDRLNHCKSGDTWDYEISEYVSFADYILDEWDAVHQMYRIDWINSTKTIRYDARSESQFNPYGRDVNGTLEYEGIPVAYRDIEGSYIKVSNLGKETLTTASTEAFKRIDENNAAVKERRLYPKFSKTEPYDGNPYYQMDGGWLAKYIGESGKTNYNFQYDVDNNIVFTKYLSAATTDDDGFINDNEALFKETVRNIRRTDSMQKLLNVPTNELYNGIIFYVTSIENDIAVIDGDVYNVITKYDTETNKVTHSIDLVKGSGYIKVGNKFFDEYITVYNKSLEEEQMSLSDKSDGYTVDAYISGDSETGYDFICRDVVGGIYEIETFQYLDGTSDSADTNYFILDDVNYADFLAQYDEDTKTWTSGWRRLKTTDKEYLKVNTIENYLKGNNPHSGNLNYDLGHEYFTYYKRLFKNPIDEDLFDERCYEDYFATIDNEVSLYGFSGLIEDNEDIKQYDKFLIEDEKIHYFGNYKENPDEEHEQWNKYYDERDYVVKKFFVYGEDSGKTQYFKDYYKDVEGLEVEHYILNDSEEKENKKGMIGGSPYSAHTKFKYHDIDCYNDEVTNQIVNNKRFKIKFNLHFDWYTEDGQEEIKYLDDIVMNYLTQMIPSTAILGVEYVSGIQKYEPKEDETSEDGGTVDGNVVVKTHTETYEFGYNCGEATSYEYTWKGLTLEITQDYCEECHQEEYKEVEGYMCDENTHIKYKKKQKFVSEDHGETWSPVEGDFQRGEVIEESSWDCGCDCDCITVTPRQDSISADGTTEPIKLADWRFASGCEGDIYVVSNDIDVTVQGNEIWTIGNVPPTEDNRRFTIEVYYRNKNFEPEDTVKCKEFQIYQNKFEPCTCTNLTVSWNYSSIPNDGIEASTTTPFATYTLDRSDCREATVTVVDEGTADRFTVNSETKKIYLNKSIEKNYETSEVPYTFNVYFNGGSDACETKVIKQIAYVKCDCGNLSISFPSSIPNKGIVVESQEGVEFATFTVVGRDDCDGFDTIRVVEESNKATFSVSYNEEENKGVINLTSTIEKNMETEVNPFKLNVYYNSDEPCTSTTINQEAHPKCDCSIIKSSSCIFDTSSNLVPNSGYVREDMAVLTVTLNEDAADCGYNLDAMLFSCTTNHASCNTSLGYLKRMSVDETNGKVEFTLYNPSNPTGSAKIGVNDDYPDRFYKIEVGYTSSGRFMACDGVEHLFNQEGKVPCKCESMGSFINPEFRHTMIPQDGYEDWTQIASGDTAIRTKDNTIFKVCGGLSAQTEVDWLTPDEESGARVLVTRGRSADLPSNMKDNLFYFFVKPRQRRPDDYAIGTLTLAFIKYKDDGTEEVVRCDGQVIELEYSSCVCQLDKLQLSYTRTIYIPNKPTQNILLYNRHDGSVVDFIFTAKYYSLNENGESVISRVFAQYPDATHNYYSINVDVGKSSESTEIEEVGYIEIRGICNPQFTSNEVHNSETYIEGSGYEPIGNKGEECKSRFNIFQYPKEECSCEYLERTVELGSYGTNPRLTFNINNKTQGSETSDTVLRIIDRDAADFVNGCMMPVFLDEGGNIVYNQGSTEPAGSSFDNTYRPNNDIELYFSNLAYNYRYEVYARLLRDFRSDEEVEMTFKAAYAIRDEHNELVPCDVTVDIELKIEKDECGNCQELQDFLVNDHDIITNFDGCELICPVVSYSDANVCANFKLAFADENFNELSLDEGFEEYNFISYINSDWYQHGLSFTLKERNTDSQKTVYLILYARDANTSNETYRGEVCKKNITVTIDVCTECEGNECSAYYELSENFKFQYFENSFYYPTATERIGWDGEHYEIDADVIQPGDDAYFFGYITYPIPENMKNCIYMTANTSDVGTYARPYTAYTAFEGGVVIEHSEYQVGDVIGLYSYLYPYDGEQVMPIDFGIELKKNDGTRCIVSGEEVKVNVKVFVIPRGYGNRGIPSIPSEEDDVKKDEEETTSNER